jgi:molybdopterin-guanine dinucleotide biosynthesis protein B
MIFSAKPVIGFAAFSGTGKTTLLCQVIPLLIRQGLRLGLIKHSHHRFEMDRPGKDSFVLRQAGAQQVLVASRRRCAIMSQRKSQDRFSQGPSLADFLERLQNTELDLILVEGYKYYPLPKIELHRPSLGHPLLAPDDPDIVAVATDTALKQTLTVPLLDINQPTAIAEFIMAYCLPALSAQQHSAPVN